MARSIRSKRERRNRAAIRAERKDWHLDRLKKIVAQFDEEKTENSQVEMKNADEQTEEQATVCSAVVEQTHAADGSRMDVSSERKPYVHLTHSEKKKLRRVKNRDLKKKLVNKMIKSKRGKPVLPVT